MSMRRIPVQLSVQHSRAMIFLAQPNVYNPSRPSSRFSGCSFGPLTSCRKLSSRRFEFLHVPTSLMWSHSGRGTSVLGVSPMSPSPYFYPKKFSQGHDFTCVKKIVPLKTGRPSAQTFEEASSASASPGPIPDPGFFCDFSHQILNNPSNLHYGVCACDVDGDGHVEFFVCGFGAPNVVLKWTGSALLDIAAGTPLADPTCHSIGVAAADFDGDGREEVYVLNTDTFGGRKRVTDRLFDSQEDGWHDLFSLPQNLDDANVCAGRSVCAVDRKGTGVYGFFVANYGGVMKLFELSPDGIIGDSASEAGLVQYPTGGRALMALPLVSQSAMDIFAGNEGSPNFLFVNKGDGSGEYVESAAAYGLMDSSHHCRGVAVLDCHASDHMGMVTGNWEGPHRLFLKSGAGPVGGATALGFTGASPEEGGYRDEAPPDMALPSRVRTVIAADFDNDGHEELFFQNIGQPNRLFRQDGAGVWSEVALGSAVEAQGLGTGGAVADIDGDGRLELLLSHGESGAQPLSLYRAQANENHWVRVQPLTKQGAPARGASVKIRDERGRWQKRVIDAGSGYLCCMEPVAHFGLGVVGGRLSMRVQWPDGAVTQVEGIEADELHVVPHP